MIEIRGLSLLQPWATLVAAQAKDVETRSWSTNYRGWIAIHASKAFRKPEREFTKSQEVQQAVIPSDSAWANFGTFDVIRGAIIGLARIENVFPSECFHRKAVRYSQAERDLQLLMFGNRIEISEQEFLFGNYRPNRFGWILSHAQGIETPIPYKGSLGLWKIDPEVTQQLESQIRLTENMGGGDVLQNSDHL